MNDTALLDRPETLASTKPALDLTEHIVEVISDSGEGAQRCGQSLAAIAARSGNGIWTVEIIPAEIQPPARSVAGASGIRIRIGAGRITNGGDQTDLVMAFNEQVLLGRVRAGELKPGATIMLESIWREHKDPKIVASYEETLKSLLTEGFRVVEMPLERECRALMNDPRRGKNMFVLGTLCSIYSFSLDLARAQIAQIFGKKDAKVIATNVRLMEAGFDWAERTLDFKFRIPAQPVAEPQVVVSGNTAIALGVLASGMDICAMYPITPATSASHYLSECFERVGGLVHQAEDEIAACAFAIGASYAGRCAVTITSGPGFSLKQEGLGLAVMAEIPLVVVNVQRGGPSTGQPTKVEQGDLLTAVYGSHGDAPKVVLAASGIEDCFYSMITARKIAETFNMVVVVLSDASLSTAQQPFPRPQFSEDWLAPPIDQTPVPEGARPYDWDPVTGIARRFIPGQPGGMHTITGLAHDRMSKVAYDPSINEEGLRAQPQAGGLAENAEGATGLRRTRRRIAAGGLGQHPGRDRGSGGSAARARAGGIFHALALHPAAALGHPGDPAAVQAGDDDRGQLVRPPERQTHRRGQPPLFGAGDDAAFTLPGRRGLLERSARPADQAGKRGRGRPEETAAQGLRRWAPHSTPA